MTCRDSDSGRELQAAATGATPGVPGAERRPALEVQAAADEPGGTGADAAVVAGPDRRRLVRIAGWTLLAALSAASITAVAWEVHNSTFQARWISEYARGLTWEMSEGATPTPLRSPRGPYDVRHGYASIPEVQRRLTQSGFGTARQARPSAALGFLTRNGIYPPYAEKNEPALRIEDPRGRALYDARPEPHLFREFVDVPPVITQALLYVENRALLDESRPQLNPALEWDRLFLSGWRYAVDRLFGTGNLSGGSTLATQVQKFRHSPGGRTRGPRDKVVQMVTASLRAYLDGPDTRRSRRDIVVTYLNSLPLGAAEGVGEVRGLGTGMEVWFGKSLEQLVVDLSGPEVGPSLHAKAQSFKEALALILATRRPGLYLGTDRRALDARIEFYLRELARERVISWELAAAAQRAPLELHRPQAPTRAHRFVDRKAANAIRTSLLRLLGVESLYQLDHLDMRVASTLDVPAQASVRKIMQKLTDPGFLRAQGFHGEHLLNDEAVDDVVYTFALYESNPNGNRLLVQADNFDRPLDLNDGTKVELGSTAKLRTLANYLNVVATLRTRYVDLSARELRAAERAALDPLSRWVTRRMRTHHGEGLEGLLWAAAERELSADHARFYTGGGAHGFENFDGRFTGDVSIRTAFQNSVNLVFIRLMRELVQFYTAEMGYDEGAILADPKHPQRRNLLEAALERETLQHLSRAWRRFGRGTTKEAVRSLCGDDEKSLRRFAVFYLSTYPKVSLDELHKVAYHFFPERRAEATRDMEQHMIAFGRRHFSLADQSWLMDRERLQIWLVRDRLIRPEAGWADVLERSSSVRREAYAWLFGEGAKRAQELRVRSELERLAFTRIHAAWRSMGYPFESLVPSLATAIGSSADRPSALADLAGVIQNEGIRVPTVRIQGLHFAEGTPYETHFEPNLGAPQRVMGAEVARVLKQLMVEVVDEGTADRVRGVLRDETGGAIAIGGKTGSGDNRFTIYDRRGRLLSSRAVNRTASFVFFVGESHYGVVTAQVLGETSGEYTFTSALALQAFNVLAPSIADLVRGPSERAEIATDHAPAVQPSNAVATP